MKRSLRVVGLASLILTSMPLAASAQDGADEPGFIAELEYRIEIGRHARFVKARRSAGTVLAPFASDGCSGGLSVGWTFAASKFPVIVNHHGKHPPWENCCVAHDRAYHTGGPQSSDAAASFEARRAADENLRQCVISAGSERIDTLESAYGLYRTQIDAIYRSIAAVMHRAVRLGGVPCTDLPWRWGFGWPLCD